MFSSARHAILVAVFIDVIAIGIAAYALISIQPPSGSSNLIAQIEHVYSQNRLSNNVNDLRRHYDQLWAGFSSTEQSREKGFALIQAAFRGGILLFSLNAFLLAIALKKQKT